MIIAMLKILDSPYYNKMRKLKIKKKRFRCLGCKKVYTENIDGIMKHSNITDRMQRKILHSCTRDSTLKDVR